MDWGTEKKGLSLEFRHFAFEKSKPGKGEEKKSTARREKTSGEDQELIKTLQEKVRGINNHLRIRGLTLGEDGKAGRKASRIRPEGLNQKVSGAQKGDQGEEKRMKSSTREARRARRGVPRHVFPAKVKAPRGKAGQTAAHPTGHEEKNACPHHLSTIKGKVMTGSSASKRPGEKGATASNDKTQDSKIFLRRGVIKRSGVQGRSHEE